MHAFSVTPTYRVYGCPHSSRKMSPGLLDLWRDPRLCPHFHMPLQSGCDSVLARMRRRYSTKDYVGAVDLIRSLVPASSITADIIVGFPGETDEEFARGVGFVEPLGFAGLHVFPYSPRPGTGAALMGDHVDSTTKRSRLDVMLDLARKQEKAAYARAVDSVRPVLWERRLPRRDMTAYAGLTDNYFKVVTQSEDDLANTITLATLSHRLGEAAWAEITH